MAPMVAITAWLLSMSHWKPPITMLMAFSAMPAMAFQSIFFISLAMLWIAFCTVGAIFSHTFRNSVCICLWSLVNCPPTLSSMVSAISLAAPELLLIAVVTCFTSASVAFMMARKPFIALVPAIVFAYWDCSAWVSPWNAERSSITTSSHFRMEPSALVISTPSSLAALAAPPVSVDRRIISERRAVPAISALIPAFAMREMLMAVSSIVYPSEPTTAPTYLNVDPIMSTVVFAFAAAAAITSARCPASSAP